MSDPAVPTVNGEQMSDTTEVCQQCGDETAYWVWAHGDFFCQGCVETWDDDDAETSNG